MSIREGHDNLAYRNYKMSDEMKRRMIGNYMNMLNDSGNNNGVLGSKEVTVNENIENDFDEGIINIEKYKKSKDDNLPLNTFFKVCVASFAVISSVGLVKFGLDNYRLQKDDLKEAHEKLKQTKVVSSGVLEDLDEQLDEDDEKNEEDFSKLYPECYNEDGSLKEGYEIRTISVDSEYPDETKTVVGRDFVEVSADEYEENYKKEWGYDAVSLMNFSYVYYLQGDKLCRISRFTGLEVEECSVVAIDHLEKKGSNVWIYTRNPGMYCSDMNDGSFFKDCNMVTPVKFVLKDDKKEETFIEKTYVSNIVYFDTSYDKRDIYYIDEDDSLWCLKDINCNEIGDHTIGSKNCTYTYIRGDKFKKVKLANHVEIDNSNKTTQEWEKGSIFIKALDGFDKPDIIEEDDNVCYRGIDYSE